MAVVKISESRKTTGGKHGEKMVQCICNGDGSSSTHHVPASVMETAKSKKDVESQRAVLRANCLENTGRYEKR